MPNLHQVEIVIHVDQALEEARREDLIAGLVRYDGVEKAHFTPGREHLLVVDYDREKLHAKDVLDYVKKDHVNAELIGPV